MIKEALKCAIRSVKTFSLILLNASVKFKRNSVSKHLDREARDIFTSTISEALVVIMELNVDCWSVDNINKAIANWLQMNENVGELGIVRAMEVILQLIIMRWSIYQSNSCILHLLDWLSVHLGYEQLPVRISEAKGQNDFLSVSYEVPLLLCEISSLWQSFILLSDQSVWVVVKSCVS